jgi:hypothetical protein
MTKQKKLIEDEKNANEIEDLNLDNDQEDLQGEEIYEYDNSIDYRSIQSRTSYDSEESIHLNRLNDKIDEIFMSSRWTIINPNKKIPKDLIPLIFQDILKELEGSEFTMVEKFVGICDYTAMNYQKAYESIHMKYKEIIVQEMDTKFGILEKKGIKKIF